MINYLIVDDESMAHEIIMGYCELLPNMSLAKNCYDALQAFEYLSKHQVDLIFLDLNMPKLKGFDFLKTLPHPPKVIVTTAHQEYALEGYELNIVDYLLKPVGFERFLKAVNKAIGSSSKNTPEKRESTAADRFFLRSNKQYIQIVLDHVLYLEAAGNYTKIVFQEETITVREKIPDLLSAFGRADIVQVHKSFAIARNHIKRIEGNRIFLAKDIVPIGKVYKRELIRLLDL